MTAFEGYSALARKYIVDGQADAPWMVTDDCIHLALDGAVWILQALTNPKNRADLDALVEQADRRAQEEEAKP